MTTAQLAEQDCTGEIEEAIIAVVDNQGRVTPEEVAQQVDKDKEDLKGCMRRLVHRDALRRVGHRARDQCLVERPAR